MVDWSTTALVFPGQGSQQVGMGADLARQFPTAAQLLQEADQVLGLSFSKLMAEGPAEELDSTYNTQPALYIVGVATLRVLEAQLGTVAPLAATGHSLGEFTALTAAGSLAFVDGLKLVRERARLMKEAGEKSPGAMAALLGPTVADTRTICEQASQETGQPVVVANDNCPGQVVISGDGRALDRALVLAEERGVRRAVKLAVSVAAHSPLMAQASAAFRDVVTRTPLQAPHYPVIGNVSAAPLRTVEEIQAELTAQLTSPVRWTESIQAMIGLGAKAFLELGPKDVLTGMLRRIDRSASGTAVNSAEALGKL